MMRPSRLLAIDFRIGRYVKSYTIAKDCSSGIFYLSTCISPTTSASRWGWKPHGPWPVVAHERP